MLVGRSGPARLPRYCSRLRPPSRQRRTRYGPYRCPVCRSRTKWASIHPWPRCARTRSARVGVGGAMARSTAPICSWSCSSSPRSNCAMAANAASSGSATGNRITRLAMLAPVPILPQENRKALGELIAVARQERREPSREAAQRAEVLGLTPAVGRMYELGGAQVIGEPPWHPWADARRRSLRRRARGSLVRGGRTRR